MLKDSSTTTTPPSLSEVSKNNSSTTTCTQGGGSNNKVNMSSKQNSQTSSASPPSTTSSSGTSSSTTGATSTAGKSSKFLKVDNKKEMGGTTGVDDIDALSVTDSGVFSDNDGYSSGRSSPVSCKEGLIGGERERFAILTYEQVRRVDSVLNEMVALEGRGNFPALELKLKDLLISVKDRLLKEGLKIRDIRLNGGAASYALMPEHLEYCFICGSSYGASSDAEGGGGLLCSCMALEAATNPNNQSSSSSSKPSKASYNDIDLIFGMELSTTKQFDRVKTAVLDAILDLLPPQVSRKRMSPCALKEAYVSKMVKVCEGDRWSLIALGNGQPSAYSPNSSVKGRSCSVELKFVDNMRRQYEFSVDSFQIVLDSLMLFYKCSSVPMSAKFYPTIVGESVYGDFTEALFHLHHGLIATRHPEEIRGGGLLKYCNLLVRGYRPAETHSIAPLQRYMCSRFFIDFPEVEQQEIKLRTYLANHMSGVGARLRYAFLVTLYQVVDSSTVCLMGHERRLTLTLIQRLAFELFANDYHHPHHNGYHHSHSQSSAAAAAAVAASLYPSSYSTFYMPQCTLATNSPALAAAAAAAAANSSHHHNSHHHQHHPHHLSIPSPTGDTYSTSSSTINLTSPQGVPPPHINHHQLNLALSNSLHQHHHAHHHKKNDLYEYTSSKSLISSTSS